MGTRRRKTSVIFFAAVFAVLISLSAVEGAQPSALEIRQALVSEDKKSLSVFLEFFDNGKSVLPSQDDLKKLTVALDGTELKTAVTTFFRSDNAFVFLIDTSNTLDSESFKLVRRGVKTWIDRMNSTDTAAIFCFGTTIERVSDFTSDKELLTRALNGVRQSEETLNDKPSSCLYQAVFNGMSAGDARMADKLVVVVFTSGFNSSGNVTSAKLRENIAKKSTPVYAMLFAYANRDEKEYPQVVKDFRIQFQNIVNETGGVFDDYVRGDFNSVVWGLFDRFANLVQMKVDNLKYAEGGKTSLKVTWTSGNSAIADTKELPFILSSASVPRASTPAGTSVSGVTVMPTSTSVRKGRTQLFSATVNGSGSPSQEVAWHVDGGHGSTAISATGNLTVAPDETATTLTVRAVSNADGSKAGTATVTLLAQSQNIAWLAMALSLPIGMALVGGGIWMRRKRIYSDRRLVTPEPFSSAEKETVPRHTDSYYPRPSPSPTPIPAPLPFVRVPNAPEIELTTISDSAHVNTYRALFQNSIVIGREPGPGNLKIPEDKHISSKHCEIFKKDGRFMIRDLKSRNGTIVSGAALAVDHPVIIEDGAIVHIGVTRLRVKLPNARQAFELPTNIVK
jgi:hypothetical protein